MVLVMRGAQKSSYGILWLVMAYIGPVTAHFGSLGIDIFLFKKIIINGYGSL